MQTLTLKDSGITVGIKKVSPLLFIELRKQFPAPKPPKQKVKDINGNEVWEENSANPEYLEATLQYSNELEQHMSALMFKRGVEVQIDQKAVDEIRAFWKEEFNKELPGSDLEVYVRYIVIQSEDDFSALSDAIISKSQPTAEDVNAAQQTFRG